MIANATNELLSIELNRHSITEKIVQKLIQIYKNSINA